MQILWSILGSNVNLKILRRCTCVLEIKFFLENQKNLKKNFDNLFYYSIIQKLSTGCGLEVQPLFTNKKQ